MKLCQIVFEEYPRDERVRRYCNILIEQNIFVYILCVSSQGKKHYEYNEKYCIIRVPLIKKRAGTLRRIYEYFVFFLASGLISSYLTITKGVKIYHVNTLPDFLVISLLFPKLMRSKIILDFHELFPEFAFQTYSMKKEGLFYKALLMQERLSVYFSDHIIAFTDIALQTLKMRNTIKESTVFMNSPDPNEMPIINRNSSDKFRIFYNGTINPNLNLSIVLFALNIIREQYSELFSKFEFHLYGDGPDLLNIQKKADELSLNCVYFHGKVEYNIMMSELAKASLLILPPKSDKYSEYFYSGKLVEMIYYKIPVILSRLKTYLHYYPEECILYFQPNNCDELVEKIMFVFNNPHKMNEITDNALFALKKVDWVVMKERYIKLIKNYQNI